jgi:CheY-like chemotaxis protein
MSFEKDSHRPRLRVLVVEDNADGAQTMASLLRLARYDAAVALDGPSALREVEDNRPDVILLDIGLPGVDGYEVARRVRAEDRAKPPFIVAITGYGAEEDRRRCEEVGIDLHLIKPADFEQVRSVLKRFERVVLPSP